VLFRCGEHALDTDRRELSRSGVSSPGDPGWRRFLDEMNAFVKT
jgi:hypothetical protein